jgi:hypothetical protein
MTEHRARGITMIRYASLSGAPVSAQASKIALADLVSLDRRDDRLWRTGYQARRADAR